MNYPQPREGIVGTLRDQDDLLSLDEKAIPRRAMMAATAMCVQDAVLVGNPVPSVKRIRERMSNPQVGDLVLETSRFYRSYLQVESFGILLARRAEWAQTDDDWNQEITREIEAAKEWGYTYQPEARPIDRDTWYVQYGPQPDDICRWHNCSFITIPTEPRFAREIDRTKGAFTRSSLISDLADAGFQLKDPK